MAEQHKQSTQTSDYDRELLSRFIDEPLPSSAKTDPWAHVVDRDEVVRRQVEEARRNGVYQRAAGHERLGSGAVGASVKLSELPPPTGKRIDNLNPPRGN